MPGSPTAPTVGRKLNAYTQRSVCRPLGKQDAATLTFWWRPPSSFFRHCCARAQSAGAGVPEWRSRPTWEHQEESRACQAQEKWFLPATGTGKASWKRQCFIWVLEAGQNLNGWSERRQEILLGSDTWRWKREIQLHCDKLGGSNNAA